jgi:hypothetical protein
MLPGYFPCPPRCDAQAQQTYTCFSSHPILFLMISIPRQPSNTVMKAPRLMSWNSSSGNGTRSTEHGNFGVLFDRSYCLVLETDPPYHS